VLKDARVVAARGSGTAKTFAAAWTAITVIAFLTMFYTTTEVFASLSYLFFFYAGYIASERMRLAEAAAFDGVVAARVQAREQALAGSAQETPA
jgi:hypothetical protein